jgi:hypothetical protein
MARLVTRRERMGEIMSWDKVTAVFVAAVLTGCAGQHTGPTYAALTQTLGPPKAGQARIVVLRREKGAMGLLDRAIPVKVDGQPVGELVTGGYISVERPAGPHQVSADVWDYPGAARHDFTAAPGRTYFFATKFNENVDKIAAATAFVGLAGAAVAMAATGENRGGVELVPLSESAARAAISELRQAQ